MPAICTGVSDRPSTAQPTTFATSGESSLAEQTRPLSHIPPERVREPAMPLREAFRDRA